MIINPRGTSGSGKTELVRRLLAQYGWQRGARFEGAGPKPIHRAGRCRPLGYRLGHPLGGRPLAVLGHYEVTSGGCDTNRAADGGLEESMRGAADYAATGHDVLIEGQRLSSEHERSAALARSHGLHILRLTTPLDQCARNLVWRRRSRRTPGLPSRGLWRPSTRWWWRHARGSGGMLRSRPLRSKTPLPARRTCSGSGRREHCGDAGRWRAWRLGDPDAQNT